MSDRHVDLTTLIKAAFLLATLFSDLDNPDCLDFSASRGTKIWNKINPYSSYLAAAAMIFSISTHRFSLLSPKLSAFSWRNGKKSSSFTSGGSYWNLSTKNYLEFDSRKFRRQFRILKCWEARSKHTHTHTGHYSFTVKKIQAFSLPYGFSYRGTWVQYIIYYNPLAT